LINHCSVAFHATPRRVSHSTAHAAWRPEQPSSCPTRRPSRSGTVWRRPARSGGTAKSCKVRDQVTCAPRRAWPAAPCSRLAPRACDTHAVPYGPRCDSLRQPVANAWLARLGGGLSARCPNCPPTWWRAFWAWAHPRPLTLRSHRRRRSSLPTYKSWTCARRASSRTGTSRAPSTAATCPRGPFQSAL
jgi:hypothetical protein